MRQSEQLPLTMDEHRELGSELRRTRARLHELCALVTEVYGPGNPAAFSFAKATEAIERLCVDLETQASNDLPGRDAGGFYSS